MTRHLGVVAALAVCSWTGLACSGGGGGNAPSGGSTGSTGGSGAGGSTAAGGNGGSSTLSSQGGSSTGGQGGSSSAGAGGSGAGGTKTGGTGGLSTAGTGGTTPSGGGGSAAGGGSGGKGTGGVGSGGVGGPGTGGSGAVGSGTGGNGSGGVGATVGSGGAGAAGIGSGGKGSGGAVGTGGATSSPVVPTTVSSTGRDSFAFGDVVFEVDPQVGARVATLSLGGTNMVATISGTDNTTWGAVFWTSPQKSWDSNWPPPAALDSDPYTGSISGNHVVLNSGSYAALGVSVSKDYSADAGTGWITIVYTIKATKAVQAAPWENCRVPRGGLAFFPAGTSLTKGPLTMTETAGIDWFDDTSKSAKSTSGEKAIADGSGGWAAYALGGNLFLRKFTNTPASAQAPGEGQDEIYPGTGFLELEVQGPYTSIPAGGNLSYTVAWRIVKIPTSVTVSAGSTTLADFAKQQAAL